MFMQPPARKIPSDCHALILENCITDSGYYREPAATIVELMNSYTEYTPDLNGLQILFRAENISLDSTRYYLTNYDAGIEIKLADSMPSVLLTGNNVNNLPICDRSMEFQELLARFMQRPNEENNFETCGVNVVNGVKPQTSAVLEDSPFQPFVPLQIESSQLPPFPLEALPQAVQDYVEAIAVHSQTSTDMAATISLGVLAIALQRKYEVMGKLGYIEPMNLYLVIVAAPGERKSAVMRDITSVISRYEQDFNQQHEQELRDNFIARKNLEKKIKRLEHRLEKKDDFEMEAELRDAEAQLAELPVLKSMRYYADDCTPEALTSLLADYDGIFSVLSTEGGIFDILSGRYSKKPNLDTWLKGHCGDNIVVDRKGRESEHINHPTLSAVLTVQPSVLGDIMSNATMEGRGLLDRFLYCSPPSRVGHRVFESPPVPPELRERYERLIFSLMALPRTEEPIRLTLSPDAAMLFSDFFLANERYLCRKGKAITGWASKYPGAVLRIAGLLHAAEHPEETKISAKTVHRAITIGRYFLAQAEFAYTQIADDQAIEKGLLVASTLLSLKKESVTHYELYHACRGRFFKEAHDIDATLELLQEHGYLRLEQPQPTGRPGRKAGIQIVVNPAFLHSHH